MRAVWLVVQREFVERVRTRAFAVGTVIFPIFIAAVMTLPATMDGSEMRNLVVVDEAPPGVADAFQALLTQPSASRNRYRLEMVSGPYQERQRELMRRVRSGAVDGIVVLPADLLERDTILYRSRSVAGPGMMRELGMAASQAAQAERLRQAGLDTEQVARLVATVGVDNARITEEGEEQGSAVSTFWAAYIVAFAIYMLVAFYGMSVMRSVLQEKTNRIAELLVSSMSSTHLMMGKIVGVGSAALLQVGIWAGAVGLFITQSGRLGSGLGVDPSLLGGSVAIGAPAALALVGFFLLGFFLYAALFAALGAAVTAEQEAQSFQMVLMVPLFIPLLLIIPLTTDPMGSVGTALGLIPFTAPVAMPIRMAAAPVPAIEIVGGLSLLGATLMATTWAAGRIYRIGILATGKRPTLGQIYRWLRMP